MQTLPILSYDLVKKLDEEYPVLKPLDSISERQLWGQIYQRRLVDHLISLLDIPPSDNETD
jgi:hypothetical protein